MRAEEESSHVSRMPALAMTVHEPVQVPPFFLLESNNNWTEFLNLIYSMTATKGNAPQ